MLQQTNCYMLQLRVVPPCAALLHAVLLHAKCSMLNYSLMLCFMLYYSLLYHRMLS